MNRTMEDTANYWLEMVVEDSYNEDMSAGEFKQTSQLLIDLLSNMILANEAIRRTADEIEEARAAVKNLLSDDPDILAAEALLDEVGA